MNTYTQHDSCIIMPNLCRYTLPQSISILKRLHLKYHIYRLEYYHPFYKRNQIISFSPKAGNYIKKGRCIYLIVNSNVLNYNRKYYELLKNNLELRNDMSDKRFHTILPPNISWNGEEPSLLEKSKENLIDDPLTCDSTNHKCKKKSILKKNKNIGKSNEKNSNKIMDNKK